MRDVLSRFSNQFRTYISILLAMCFWALSFIWYKEAYLYFTPISTVFFRLITSVIILFPILLLFRISPKIKKKDIRWFLLLALFEPFLYFMGESFGMLFVTPVVASIIVATIPVITPLAAWMYVGEKPDKYVWIGVFFSFFGVCLVMFYNGKLSASPLGVLLMFLAALSTVGYSVILKRLATSYNPINIIAWQNTIGAAYFIPLFITFFPHEQAANWTIMSFLPILKLSVFASSLAFVFYTIAMKRLGVIRTNVFINLIPIFTAIFSFYILNERFNIFKILGILVVIAGVLLSQFQKYQANRR